MDAALESLIVAREARSRATGIAARRRSDAPCADGLVLATVRGRLVAAIADGAASSDPAGMFPRRDSVARPFPR
jgi:hypothetical protein